MLHVTFTIEVHLLSSETRLADAKSTAEEIGIWS
jgi:hypothetical protein